MSEVSATASLALAAYAESWISGARIVVVGSATSPLAERLVERGARLVHVYDPDTVRVAEATARRSGTQIVYGPLENAEAARSAGSFDFGIIEDLCLRGTDTARTLSVLSRSLSRRGMALVASPNPEARRRLIGRPGPDTPLDYYELYEAVSEHFREVRMLGQTPFVGYAIADFSEDASPDVRLDTAFLPHGAEEPEWFLALVSDAPADAESFSVIQLPFEEVHAASRDNFEPKKPTRSREDGARLAQLERERRDAVEKASELEAELAKREDWLESLEARAATADQRADEALAEVERLNDKSSDAQRRLAKEQEKLQVELQALSQRLVVAARERGQFETERDRAQGEARRLTETLSRLREDGRKATESLAEQRRANASLKEARDGLVRERDDARQTLSKNEKVGAEAEDELRSLQRKANELEGELRLRTQEVAKLLAERRAREEAPPESDYVSELEERLTDRAGEVARLERELHSTERFGRDLILQLTELRSEANDEPGGNGGRERVTELAHENARLEADLESARWAIAHWEHRYAEAPSGAQGPSKSDSAATTPPASPAGPSNATPADRAD